jgi:membrane protein
MANRFSKLKKLRQEAQALWDESALRSHTELSKMQKFAHFCVMVCRSFSRNRCPVRAAALAYVSLLALIPMLAVIVGVTSTFLKKEGEERIDQFIVKFVASVTPPAMLTTNIVAVTTNVTVTITNAPAGTNQQAVTNQVESVEINKTAPIPPSSQPLPPGERGATVPTAGGTNVVEISETTGTTNQTVLPTFAQGEDAIQARRAIARNINQFIQNTQSGTLGATGTVMLIFVAIGMLARIEDTFNDIWGVARGRGWFTRIVLYWGVIALAPVLLVAALGLASGPHLEGTKEFVSKMPFIGNLIFQFLPVVVLSLTFALFYMLMPNTKVDWRAALVGGAVAGLLWHVVNLVSVLYVSRVVANSKIYGSLGLVPVFMMGLYSSWVILLFGAQVAYAFQNRASYLEEKQIENINQRGREFVALRLMTCIGERFLRGEPPPTAVEIGQQLCVPSRLVLELMQTLAAAHLVVEVAGLEPAFFPARPLERITCHDVLMALRASQGEELVTRDEPTRSEVLGEFNRIEEAERHAASSVTMLALASRAQAKQLAG